MANEKGFSISRMNFYREIRNPVYCGKIVVKKYKDEEEQWVNGLHEPLISEALFYKVQDILNGRTKVMRVQAVKINEGLPLQGFLQCATCDRQLTGSASKGRRGGYYYYYHAQAIYGCGCRYRAEQVNKAVLDELVKFIPLPGMNELYKLVVLDLYKKYAGDTTSERKDIAEQIGKLNSKLANARELLFDEKIDHSDFAIMKKDCEEKIKRLEASLTEMKMQKPNTMSIDNMLFNAIEALSKLKFLFEGGDALTKKEVLGSIYREKLRFDGKKYRTPRLNEAARLIYHINNKLRGNKNGKERDSKRLSRAVLRAGIEPALL